MSFEKSELCVEVESSIADVLEGLAQDDRPPLALAAPLAVLQ